MGQSLIFLLHLCRYQLHEDAADRVTVDPRTGDIISATELDHEAASFLRFHVLATDDSAGTDDTRAASALVIIAILNVDDEVPVFEQQVYNLSVPENQPAMTLVGHVVARDGDAPPYDELQYHLNGGVDADAFVLDPKTGSLRTRKMLDRERKSEYHVRVMAESVGREAGSHRAFANVTVRVGDLNDHAPIVTSPSGGNGSVHVISSTRRGQLVTRIRAEDADDGANARLTYNWNSEIETETGSTPPPFRIDPQTGSVYLTASLDDLPDGTTYKLHVVVRDNGIRPTASTATLYIIVDRDIFGAERSRSGAATSVNRGREKFRFVLEGKLQLAVVIVVIVLCIILAGALLAAIVVCRRRRTRCPPDGATSDGKHGDLTGSMAIHASGGQSTDGMGDATDMVEPVIVKMKPRPKPLAAVVTTKNDRLQV